MCHLQRACSSTPITDYSSVAVLCEEDAIDWSVYLVNYLYALGVCIFSIHSDIYFGYTLGIYIWSMHLGYTLGIHTWSTHLGYTLGVHTWGTHLGCTVAIVYE